jgi:hypothetical protein
VTFHVFPASLDGYAAQLDRAAGDARDTKGYLVRYSEIANADGALVELAVTAQRNALGAAVAATERAMGLLEASRNGLTSAARYYRTTDAAAAARADALLPSTCPHTDTALAQAWAENPCAPSYGDSRAPAGRLKPVDNVEYSHPLSFLDSLSVSHWALQAFDLVFGFNPLDKVFEFFAGDWEAIARAGVAIGRAADAVYDVGYNVQGGAVALSDGWEGSAASTARAYFTDLADGLADMKEPLKQISRQFDAIAHGVWSACEAVSGFAKGIVDQAIIAGIALAAGTITAETGVGALVGYGVAALEVANMLRMWGQATSAMQAIYGAVQFAAGVIETQIAQLDTAKLPEFPGGSGYHHPLVAS